MIDTHLSCTYGKRNYFCPGGLFTLGILSNASNTLCFTYFTLFCDQYRSRLDENDPLIPYNVNLIYSKTTTTI
jgi:hypothetical protein